MSPETFRIAILASGNGSNAEKIIAYFRHHARVTVALVLSNNPDAFVLKRAERLQIPARSFTRAEFSASDTVLQWLKDAGISHIVLAGFLWLIPRHLIDAYPERIVNIHPALLPKYGGKGMYGSKVHEAVKNAGEKETGITIHLVNENYDEGKILFQKTCPVETQADAERIASCVQALEHEYYPKVIEDWIVGR